MRPVWPFFVRVQLMKSTDISPDYIFKMVTAVYNGVSVKSSADDYVTPFKFSTSYNLLRKHAKFIADLQADSAALSIVLASGNTDYSSEVDEDSEEVPVKVFKRPIERRKAKDELLRTNMMTKKLRVTKYVLSPHQARNKILKEYFEVMTVSNLPIYCDKSNEIKYFNILGHRSLLLLRYLVVDENYETPAATHIYNY